MNYKLQNAFTLVELLVVIGILTILLAIPLVALNPSTQFSKARNAKRQSDTTTILSVVAQYTADTKGALPAGIDTTVRTISNDTDITDRVDLCSFIIPQYATVLPVDPLTNNGAPVSDCIATYNTNYTIVQNAANNSVTVAAPAAELGVTIVVTR